MSSSSLDDFDPDRLRLEGAELDTFLKAPKRQRRRQQGRFLRGPIPWSWISRAHSLPGQALAVGLCLWQRAGWQRTGKQNQPKVQLCLAQVGLPMDIQAARRALHQLAEAGLVGITRRTGRGLEVELIVPDAGATDQ
jgi:hypothetical protein